MHLLHHYAAASGPARRTWFATKLNPRPGPEPLLAPVGERYASMPDQSADQRVIQLYEQYAAETQAIYDTIQVPVKFVDLDPYQDGIGWPDANKMRDQVVADREILITKIGNTHPLLNADQNLRGRTVHDLLAHLVCGCDFEGQGELNAFEAQSAIYSANLRPVLFGEIVGQAAYFLSYGKFMEPQKTVLFPVEVELQLQGLRKQYAKGLGLAGVVELGLVSDKIFEIAAATGYRASYSYAVLEQQDKSEIEYLLREGRIT